MRKLKLVGLAALALFAFAALTASSAFAEEDKNVPQLLVLEGGNVTTLGGTLVATKGSDIKLVSLSLLHDLTAETAEINLNGCKEEGGSKLDTTLCEDASFKFTGVKTSGGVQCNNTGTAGEVIGLLDLHLGAEESLEEGAEMKLQPVLFFKVLGGKNGKELTSPLLFVCGLIVTVDVRGYEACLLLPGLTNVPTTKNVEVLCKADSKSDLVTGHCEVLCEPFGKGETTLESSLDGGKTWEDVAELVHVEGKLTQDIFIDD